MANPILNYTGRDFSAEFERLVTLLRAILPEYTDLNPSDAGRALIELLGRQTDLLNLYSDRAAQEGFITQAIHRKSLCQLGRTIDYLPTLASPAATRLRLTRVGGVVGDIFIPAHSAFARADGLNYRTLEDATILAADNTLEVDVVQGDIVTQTIEPGEFTTTDWTGRPRYNLGTYVVNEAFTMTHGASPTITWEQVDSFWRSTQTDYHYLLELDGDDDTVWLTLGDGVAGNGAPDEALSVTFLRTAGATGNSGIGTITGVPDGFDEIITCTNIEAATGGAASETTESLRAMIPRMARTQRRGLTCEDYETLLMSIPGVLHCQAVDRNTSSDWPYMYVFLYVVPDGGGPLSTYLRGLITAACREWGHMGTWSQRYIVEDAAEVPVAVSARIGVLDGYQTQIVRAQASAAISGVFAPELLTVGGGLDFVTLHSAVSAVPGVSWVEFITPATSVAGTVGSILTAGTISVAVVG